MKTSELIGAVEKAFSGIKRPATSLNQYKLTDEKGIRCEITNQEWVEAGKNRKDFNWTEIADTEIDVYGCQLAHMQAEEFQYYLPAYMRYSLKKLTTEGGSDEILCGTVFALSPSRKDAGLRKYNLSQYSLLTEAQKAVIAEFLHFISINVEDFERDALRAYSKYWQQCVSPNKSSHSAN